MRLGILCCLMAACGSSKASQPDAAVVDASVKVDFAVGDSAVLDDAAEPPDATMVAKAPAAAAAVGYDTLTFGPDASFGKNWFFSNFFGAKAPSNTYATNNSDGTLTLVGPGSGNGGTVNISTVALDSSKPNGWYGTAFGGGGYFEAVYSFSGASAIEKEDALCFWSNDVEHASNNGSNSNYTTTWPGQANNYEDWVEIDIMEFDAGSLTQYGTSLHNWYAVTGSSTVTNLPTGSPVIAPNNDWGSFQKYGLLWVPATDTKQGYLKFYENDVQVGNTVSWNKYDATKPPPPSNVDGTAGAILDLRHLYLILDTNAEAPMTVKSVSVWQATGANNWVQP